MNGAATIGLLLVDDHAIVREGYRALLARQPGLQVLAEADDGATAYQQFKASGRMWSSPILPCPAAVVWN